MTASRRVEIVNERGLHARASAKFVKLASEFDAEVRVSREGSTVDARSIMGLMMLAAGVGSEVEIEAEGPQADQAVDALTNLIANRFDEGEMMGGLTRLIAVLAFTFFPLSAVAQNLCHGRHGCESGPTVPAGRDQAGVALRILSVSVPQAETAGDDRHCNDATTEYWLQRGAAPPRLIARACSDMRVAGDGIEAVIGANRITFDFGAGSGCCYGFYRAAYQLSPLRILHAEACDSNSNSDGANHEQWVHTSIDPATLQGETAALIEPSSGPEDGVAADCDADHPTRRWLPIIRLQTLGVFASGIALGSCAAAMGPDGGGYLLEGRRTATEIRLLAPSARSLVIQVADPGAPASASGPLASRNHLEVWSSDRGPRGLTPADDHAPPHWLIDAATGQIEAASGSGTPPHATSWPVTLPGGRHGRVIRLDFPPSDPEVASPNTPPAVTVVYRQFEQGELVMALASSQFSAPTLSRLGESFDVSTLTHCAVRDRALDVVQAGHVQAPIEAAEAAGLRFNR